MSFDLSKCIGFVTDTAIKNIMEDFNRRLEKEGSTRIQWIALYFLSSAEKPTSQKELALMMNIQDSTLARLVDRMVRDELLIRVENQADKRVKFIELTEKGRMKIRDLMPIGENFSDLLLTNISSEELDSFQNVLDKMMHNIKHDISTKE